MAEVASEQQGEWAGLPIPVHEVPLIMEPRHPLQNLNGMAFNKEKEPQGLEKQDFETVNHWYDRRRDLDVFIFRETRGLITWSALPRLSLAERFNAMMNTFCVGAEEAWTVEAETRAIGKLEQLLKPHIFKQYQLSGMFIETSPRSLVTYVFRKLRPTLALRPNRYGKMEMIAALCLHPIGYYQQSYAGCMVPTDDVIAHLVMMRGDERLFWAKANQTAHLSEAAL